MVKEAILGALMLISTALFPVSKAVEPLLSPIPENQEMILVEHRMDLSNRNEIPHTNEIFGYNILLAIHYFNYSFTLEPGEVFAFHENVTPEFSGQPLKTGWTSYTAAEGYKTVGGLPGNGVCHLASLMNWAAQDAGLEVVAKVNHNFFLVPGVPKEFGTSIKYMPNGGGNTQNQNLYIKNNFDYPVKFDFSGDDKVVKLAIIK